VKLLYFAWVRERMGVGEEELSPPPEVATVAALLDWLEQRGPRYQHALADRRTVRVAVNQQFADSRHPVGPDDEIAFFPPVTGG
jgi:molybdopterin converting factor subunit 1